MTGSSDDPYAPPRSSLAPPLPPPLPPPLHPPATKGLKIWLTICYLLPALDISFPLVFTLATGRVVHQIYWYRALVGLLLIMATVLVWRSKSKLVLFSAIPAFLALGSTSKLPFLGLGVSFVLLLILYSHQAEHTRR